MTLSEIFEGLTAIGLFISVALVFVELRRNGRSSRLNNSILFTERHFNLRNQTLNQEMAGIIMKGRKGLEQLNETEKFMFCSYLLNTALTGSLMISGNAGKNLTAGTAEAQGARIIKDEWDNQGGREYWNKIKNDPPLVPHSRALVERVLEQ